MGCLDLARCARRLLGDGKNPFRRALAQTVKNINRMVYACDIGLGAVIPESCEFAHQGLGCAINTNVVMGERCLIYQNVTIGGNRPGGGSPVIGSEVLIGAGAKVLGPIRVGDRSVIGANSVVPSDVPAGVVVAGAPAKVIKNNDMDPASYFA